MKKLISITMLLMASIGIAQDAAKIVADETCLCVTDLMKNGQTKITDIQLGLCMVKSYSAHKSEFPKKMQVSLTDSAGFEAVAAEIGMKMVESCPDIIMGIASDEGFADEFSDNRDISISGQITDIRNEQFVTIEMKDDNGKKYTMLFLYYFDAASLFTDGKIKSGDKVTASYTETELYDPKMKEFRTYKVLTNLSK